MNQLSIINLSSARRVIPYMAAAIVCLTGGIAIAHPPATIGSEQPFSGDNPTCGDIDGLDFVYEYKLQNPPGSPDPEANPSGQYTDPNGPLVVDVTTTVDPVYGYLFSWTKNAGVLVNGVIVKGGPRSGGNAYLYDNQPTPVAADSGLHAAPAGDGKFASISHVTFCYIETDTEYQGCTLGYWKNHTNSWTSPYLTGTTLGSVFTGAPKPGDTLLTALKYKGGPKLSDKINLLLKQAVAAINNAQHPDVNYPLTVNQIITKVNAAIASGDQILILSVQQELNSLNNAGCPLN